jgi:NADH-quinone oxidoreductase subunit G
MYEFNYPVANNIAVAQQSMVAELAAIAAAVYQLSGNALPKNIATAVSKAESDVSHQAIARQLMDARAASVILGNSAQMHPQFSALRVLADAIARETNSTFGYLSDGCNAAGAWLAGALPHRGAGGATENITAGKNLAEINQLKLAACLLVNIEPDTDALDAHELMATLKQADFVVSLSVYNSASVKKVADVMLPAASFMETSGTFVNAEGYWQSFKAVVDAKGGSRPAWKILRVLGNLSGLDGFDYFSSEDVKNEVRSLCESVELSNTVANAGTVKLKPAAKGIYCASDVPMYQQDAIVRRATSLQKTVDAQSLCVRLNSAEAKRLGVSNATTVTVKRGEGSAAFNLLIDDTVPDACAWIPSAVEGNELLPAAFSVVSIERIGADTAAGAGA